MKTRKTKICQAFFGFTKIFYRILEVRLLLNPDYFFL